MHEGLLDGRLNTHSVAPMRLLGGKV